MTGRRSDDREGTMSQEEFCRRLLQDEKQGLGNWKQVSDSPYFASLS